MHNPSAGFGIHTFSYFIDMKNENGKLYIVATPIGNLADMTFRAVQTLQNVNAIYAEDTRVTKKLLNHYEIKTAIFSFNAHDERKSVDQILKRLEGGELIALVTDAGTPAISDPGTRLVAAAHDANFEVIAIPGASAVTAALSACGIPAPWTFIGFLPQKKGRQTALKGIAASESATVCFESTHRLQKILTELRAVLAEDRLVCVCREMTKAHEEIVRGTPKEVLDYYEKNTDKVKGECVLVISGVNFVRQ